MKNIVLGLAAAAAATAAAAAPADAEATVVDGVADVPIDVSQGFVIVEVAVNGGAPHPFILDTGASGSLVDAAALPGVDLAAAPPSVVKGEGGEETLAEVRVESLGVGGATVKDITLTAGDLTPLRRLLSLDVAGVLGYDFLKHFVMRLDFDESRLAFYDPAAFTPPAGVAFVAAETSSGHPVVEMSVDDYTGRFVVDLGNRASVILDTAFVRENGLVAKAERSLPALLGGAGGAKTLEAAVVRARELKLAGFSLPRPIVVLSVGEGGLPSCAANVIGNVGWGVLSRFTLYIDYPGGRLGVAPGKQFDSPFDYDRAGILMRFAGDHYVVEKVASLSPAAAFLAPGDKVVAINGRPAAEVAPIAWANLRAQPPGTRITLTRAREGGATADVVVELAELL